MVVCCAIVVQEQISRFLLLILFTQGAILRRYLDFRTYPDTNKRQEVKDLLENSGCSAAVLVASTMKMDPNSAQFKDQWPTFKRVVEKKISARRSTVTGAMKIQAERKLRWCRVVLSLYKNKSHPSFFCHRLHRGLF